MSNHFLFIGYHLSHKRILILQLSLFFLTHETRDLAVGLNRWQFNDSQKLKNHIKIIAVREELLLFLVGTTLVYSIFIVLAVIKMIGTTSLVSYRIMMLCRQVKIHKDSVKIFEVRVTILEDT